MGSVKDEGSPLPVLIKVVDLPVDVIAAKPHLVSAHGICKILVQGADDVVAAFRRGDAEFVESDGRGGARASANFDFRRTDQRRIGHASVQAQGDRVLSMVGVGEYLVVVVDAGGELIGHPRGERCVPGQGVVLYMRRAHFEIVRQSGSRGRDLGPLPYIPFERELIVLRQNVVQLDDAIVAETGFIGRTDVVVRSGRTGEGGGGP